MKPGKHNPGQQMPPPAEVEALLALYNEQRYAEAESRTRALLKHNPESGFGWKLLGVLLYMLGKDPLPALQKTAQLLPGDAEAHSNLGNALNELGRYDEAAASCRRALKLVPDFAEAHSNLGNALKGLGELAAAAASYRSAVKHKPDFAIAYSNLGNVLKELGQFEEAVSICRRAVELNPDFADAHVNLGNALKEFGQLEKAVASYRRAVELKPDFAIVHNNLGLALHALGQPDAALASYCRALEIKPDYAEAYSNMLYMHAFTRDIPPEEECRLAANWEEIALNENERIAARERSFDHAPRAGRKLKLGVVSAELGQHPVAEFLQPILEHLERSRFHVTLYPTAARTESRAAKIRELADEYISLVGLSDDKAADLSRSGQIDILVDTTAHMRDSRMGIFARRAAPVQCHYIGYHGTTGLTEMDWYISDEVLLPVAYDAHFRERIWRLPRLRLAYKGDPELPESRWTPSPDGTIWLGSFNNLTKVREEALGLWAKVMKAIPESRLLLKDRLAEDAAVRERIRTELGRHSIADERVEFVARVPDWRSHMVLYDRLDIALDAIPLNSETTAFDALWMGVPLVALEGNWVGGRMASTILKALGKLEWIARDEDEYVRIVAALANDVQGRKSLRAMQRSLLANSSLCDAEGLTRVLEDAFGAMYDQWFEKREGIRTGTAEK
jgi:protein O-GlcNAc transferase